MIQTRYKSEGDTNGSKYPLSKNDYTPIEVIAMFQKSWKLTATGIDGNVKLFGVNIFEYEWHSTGEKVAVSDSSREADIYTIMINRKERRFAAIERSYCVWEFYEYRW